MGGGAVLRLNILHLKLVSVSQEQEPVLECSRTPPDAAVCEEPGQPL